MISAISLIILIYIQELAIFYYDLKKLFYRTHILQFK